MNQQTINRHLDRLAKNDPELRRGLAQVGYPPPRIRPPGFETLFYTADLHKGAMALPAFARKALES